MVSWVHSGNLCLTKHLRYVWPACTVVISGYSNWKNFAILFSCKNWRSEKFEKKIPIILTTWNLRNRILTFTWLTRDDDILSPWMILLNLSIRLIDLDTIPISDFFAIKISHFTISEQFGLIGCQSRIFFLLSYRSEFLMHALGLYHLMQFWSLYLNYLKKNNSDFWILQILSQ